jgi:ABC-type lipoprotein export system ATPase subunit
MVTHDLRMCRYVDRVIQMMDGQIHHIVDGRDAIDALVSKYQAATGD